MSAEVLREAAALMRERAKAAPVGPWRVVDKPLGADVRGLPENTSYDYRGDRVATAGDSEFGGCVDGAAPHIASWHPAVAFAVADWLDLVANWSVIDEALWAMSDTHQFHALMTARAYLNT